MAEARMTADRRLAPDPTRICSVDGCELRAKARGLCNRHYMKARYQGVTEHARAYARTYAREHQDRARVLKRAWTERNRAKLNARKAQRRREDYVRIHAKETAYRIANRERINAGKRRSWNAAASTHKIRRREQQYNLSPAAYARLLDLQEGKCAICRADAPLQVDHDHASGKVRGLLCSVCNLTLGRLRDSPELLRAAAAYLEATR